MKAQSKSNAPDGKPALVELRWHVEVDPRRHARIGEILADILDTARDSGGPSKP